MTTLAELAHGSVAIGRGRSDLESRVAALARQAMEQDFDTDTGTDTDVDGGEDAVAVFVPGRIEVLGKHTDYAGGRSLTLATRQGFCCVATARGDGRLRAYDARRREFEEVVGGDARRSGHGDWRVYVETVYGRAIENFGALSGADLVFESDLPPASGLSSSSAFVVGLFLVLSELSRLDGHPVYERQIRGPLDLAGYLSAVENGRSFGSLEGESGVGTLGGSEDHTAILCSEEGRLGLYSYAPEVRHADVALPDDWAFVVAASGVRAKKAGPERDRYNRLSLLAREAAKAFRSATGSSAPHLAAVLREVTPEAACRAIRSHSGSAFSVDDLVERLEHFAREDRCWVERAWQALETADAGAFGAAAEGSFRDADSRLGNQIDETRALVRIARQEGAFAASAFGAGFGGAVWATVPTAERDGFLRRWRRLYVERYPEHEAAGDFFATDPSGPARRLA